MVEVIFIPSESSVLDGKIYLQLLLWCILVETLKIVSPILIFEMGGWGYLRVFLPTKCKAMS